MLHYNQIIREGSWFDRLFGEVKGVLSYFEPKHVKNYASAWNDVITDGARGIKKAVEDSAPTIKNEAQDLSDMVKDTATRLRLPWQSESDVEKYQKKIPHIYDRDNFFKRTKKKKKSEYGNGHFPFYRPTHYGPAGAFAK